MTVRLYMDHHVPAAVTDGLRHRDVDVLTAQEDGTAALDDEPLLAKSTQLDRVLYSQDRDLLIIAHYRAVYLPGNGFENALQADADIQDARR